MAREKYSVAGRFSRPPLENLKDGCVTAMKKEKSPPEVKRPQTGRECNNKGTDCSALDVTVLFQVVHEMLRRVGPHRHPVQFPVPPGEIHHVLLIGAPAVKPAALTQDAYKLGRAGGGNPAAIRQNTWSRFFYYRYFKCLKSLFDRLPSGMIAWIRMYRIFYLPDSIMVPAIRFFSAAVAFFLVASWSVTGWEKPSPSQPWIIV